MRAFFILAVSCCQLFAGGEAHNGGGAGEQNLTVAFLKLQVSIALCLTHSQCNLNKKERALLQEIERTLKNGKELVDQLVFKSEKQEPGFFVIDGVVKSARTGDDVGDPIYVNTDHLYTESKSGVLRPKNVVDDMGLLVFELAHHHGIRKGADELKAMDILCAKLTTFLSATDHESTQIVGAQLHWNGKEQVNTIVQYFGFADDVPSPHGTKAADAVKTTRFCYIGKSAEVCPQIKQVCDSEYAGYAEDGRHMGLKFISCEVDKERDTVIAKYTILDDYSGNFDVTRAIRPCKVIVF